MQENKVSPFLMTDLEVRETAQELTTKRRFPAQEYTFDLFNSFAPLFCIPFEAQIAKAHWLAFLQELWLSWRGSYYMHCVCIPTRKIHNSKLGSSQSTIESPSYWVCMWGSPDWSVSPIRFFGFFYLQVLCNTFSSVHQTCQVQWISLFLHKFLFTLLYMMVLYGTLWYFMVYYGNLWYLPEKFISANRI